MENKVGAKNWGRRWVSETLFIERLVSGEEQVAVGRLSEQIHCTRGQR